MPVLSEYYMEIECIVRILIAAVCGSFIGIERKVRLKEAGTRTHLVVAFGSALFMIVSKYDTPVVPLGPEADYNGDFYAETELSSFGATCALYGETLSEEDVENFCKSLPRYQRPRKLIFAAVPRNPTGKIEKPLLRKTYGGANLVAQQNELK